MSPREEVEALYRQIPCQRTFDYDRALHEVVGYVFDLPDLFIMGRGVDRLANPHEIMDPHCRFHVDEQNCWHVYACAGDVRRIWGVLPYHLPWLCWQRGRTALADTTELRFYPARRALEVSVRKNLSHNGNGGTIVAASRPCWSQLTLDDYAKYRSA